MRVSSLPTCRATMLRLAGQQMIVLKSAGLTTAAFTFAVFTSAAIAAFILSGGTAVGQARLSDAQIVRNFDVIALRNEHVRLRDPRITKWGRPIRYFLQQDVQISPIVAKDARDHMARLSRLTGVPIREVGARRAANFLIIFTRMRLFEQRIRENLRPYNPALARRLNRASCIGIFRRATDSNEIVRAVAIIPVDFARERGILFGCIVEETTQLMGLPNDSSDVYPSIFNDESRLDDLSWHDKLLLRMLYHPQMRAGLRRREALAVARRILPGLRARPLD